MILGKTVFAGLLCAIYAAFLGPSLVFQEPTAGQPDDVAELLPVDTVTFAEVTKPALILRDWKDYVGAFCTKDGRQRVWEWIEKLSREGLDAVPEKLMKDLTSGILSIQRVAFATVPVEGDRTSWAVIATASDGDFFGKIIEDLRVFESEELEHGEAKIIAIRRIGEADFGAPVFLAASGNRLLVSRDSALVSVMLDRAAGKRVDEDLRRSSMYRGFAAAAEDAPLLRAFAAVPWSQIPEPPRGRWATHGTDMLDAVFQFSKIRGEILEARLRPGKIEACTRVLVDSPCRLYDAWRQPAGTKEILRYVSADVAAVAHVNLKGGAGMWKDLENLLRRYDRTWQKSGKNRHYLEAAERTALRSGCTCEELAGIMGDEAVLAFAADDSFKSEERMSESAFAVIRITDAEKARNAVETYVAGREAYEILKEGDAAYYVSRERGEPCFALHGAACVVAMRRDLLKVAIKTFKEENSFLTRLPPEAASVPKFIVAKHRALWAAIPKEPEFFGGIPDFTAELNLTERSTLLMTEEAQGLRLTSSDSGLGAFFQASLFVALGLIPSLQPAKVLPRWDPRRPGAGDVPVEEAARRAKAAVEDLRSGDLAARDAASAELKRLGSQADPFLAETLKEENDPETRARLLEVLCSEVEAILGKSRPLATWNEGDNESRFYRYLEPQGTDRDSLAALRSTDALGRPVVMNAIVEKVAGNVTSAGTRRSLAAMLAFLDCSVAQEALVAARLKAEDPEIKAFLQVALGWCRDAQAKNLLLKGFKDRSRWISRASFVAAERMTDPAVVDRLIELLGDSDHETRWNASYTLRRLTGGKVSVNVYESDDEYAAACAKAAKWWQENRSSYR